MRALRRAASRNNQKENVVLNQSTAPTQSTAHNSIENPGLPDMVGGFSSSRLEEDERYSDDDDLDKPRGRRKLQSTMDSMLLPHANKYTLGPAPKSRLEKCYGWLTHPGLPTGHAKHGEGKDRSGS
jgi:hypothetical protein